MSKIVITSVYVQAELDFLSSHQVETVSTLSTSSRGVMVFDGVPVSVEKVSLKQSRASRYKNSLMSINFS